MDVYYTDNLEIGKAAMYMQSNTIAKTIVPSSYLYNLQEIGSSPLTVEVEWDTGYLKDTATKTCSPIWGDGLKVTEEECEDGNSVDADGWSSSCQIEHGYKCSGWTDGVSNDTCTTTWGDGEKANVEGWDDGNLVNGDGWDENWETEYGYYCEGGDVVGSASNWTIKLGDGLRSNIEVCDDGDLIDGNGWDSNSEYTKWFRWDFVQDSPDNWYNYVIPTEIIPSAKNGIFIEFGSEMNLTSASVIDNSDIEVKMFSTLGNIINLSRDAKFLNNTMINFDMKVDKDSILHSGYKIQFKFFKLQEN
jgi:cysteine-rich repeat protein